MATQEEQALRSRLTAARLAIITLLGALEKVRDLIAGGHFPEALAQADVALFDADEYLKLRRHARREKWWGARMNASNSANDGPKEELDGDAMMMIDDEPTLPTGWAPLKEFEAGGHESPRAPMTPRRRNPMRSRSLTCGLHERAALYQTLVDAIIFDEYDEIGRELVQRMDDSVLVFLVRAIVNGQLAPDGRLFLRTEELALPARDEG